MPSSDTKDRCSSYGSDALTTLGTCRARSTRPRIDAVAEGR